MAQVEAVCEKFKVEVPNIIQSLKTPRICHLKMRLGHFYGYNFIETMMMGKIFPQVRLQLSIYINFKNLFCQAPKKCMAREFDIQYFRP
jgi:hypothetical protein